jgi:methyl-accepting chemotaxis protein
MRESGESVESDGDDDETLGGRESASEDIDIATDALLDTFPQPAFLIDTQHRVVGWNREMEVLTGIDRSEVLGDDDTAKFFRDDRTQTLANAVVEHPDSADEEFGAERSGRDQRAYEVEQEMENQDGDLLYVHSVATPIYQDGSLEGVIQLVQDNTDIIRRREAMGELVEEAADTAQALEDGNI